MKKWLFVLLALTVLAGLVACGKEPVGRLTKGFMNFRGSGDFDTFPYWIEFEIK